MSAFREFLSETWRMFGENRGKVKLLILASLVYLPSAFITAWREYGLDNAITYTIIVPLFLAWTILILWMWYRKSKGKD